jgi:hypothetical protein
MTLQLINSSFKQHVMIFIKQIKFEIRLGKVQSTLTAHQRGIMRTLCKYHEIVAFPAEKIWGEFTVEHKQHIPPCLNDQLKEPTIYIEHTQVNENALIPETKSLSVAFHENSIGHHLNDYHKQLVQNTEVKYPLAEFYISVKINKSQWKSRTSMNVPGSILHGLSRWNDQKLQSHSIHNTAFLSTHYMPKNFLISLPLLLNNARLITAYADITYTSIDLEHSLRSTHNNSILNEGQVRHKNIHALRTTLKIETITYIFLLGIRYWIQLIGTDMGMPLATTHAIVYSAFNDNCVQRKHLVFTNCKQYIDDICRTRGTTKIHDDTHRWSSDDQTINNDGKMMRQVSNNKTKVDYFDTTIHIY